jgi:hypothetical protein
LLIGEMLVPRMREIEVDDALVCFFVWLGTTTLRGSIFVYFPGDYIIYSLA